MRKFGLIGYPLGHSFSKKYFDGKFAREGISDSSYDNFQIKSLEYFTRLIHDNKELCGLNVTIPFKTEILKFVDVLENGVDKIGAVNVLKIKRLNSDIKIYGYNSDITGIRESVLPFMNGKIRNALILGSGGSSKAVSFTLTNLGINVTIVSRTRKPGTITYSEISSECLEETDMIINATPVGMYPDISAKPDIDYDKLNENHILFDLVYNPEMTMFLESGKERGCKIITGLKMLYSQAERSWEIWNNDTL